MPECQQVLNSQRRTRTVVNGHGRYPLGCVGGVEEDDRRPLLHQTRGGLVRGVCGGEKNPAHRLTPQRLEQVSLLLHGGVRGRQRHDVALTR